MRAAEVGREKSSRHWKMLAQRRLREVLAMLEDDGAELGDAFELVDEAGMAIDALLRRQEAGDG